MVKTQPQIQCQDGAQGLAQLSRTEQDFFIYAPHYIAEKQQGVPEEDATPAIDLLNPPGFVGEVAHWKKECSSGVLEKMCVASALFDVGNVGGLTHVMSLHNTTTNLILFCVAGSGTGKGVPISTSKEIYREVGISRAYAGYIQSSQAIVRNFATDQAQILIKDEVDTLLAKVANAQRTGGASYNEELLTNVIFRQHRTGSNRARLTRSHIRMRSPGS